MTLRSIITKAVMQEDLNFLLTNRIPRRLATQAIGWLSRVEQPLVRDLSLWVWRVFSDLDLTEAKKTRFKSLHDCFTRELKEGVRPIDADPSVLVSPCDGVIGACGSVSGTDVIQIKGAPYSLRDLLGPSSLVDQYRDGCYVTLRLTSAMYHRFHAPHDCLIEEVIYHSGDVWNVNPIALKRVEKLFCKNERAVIRTQLAAGHPVILVPVAAVLVASIKLHFLNVLLHLKYRGPNPIKCSAEFRKGEELGYFQHGSTIIVFAPKGFSLCDDVNEGSVIRVGRPLMRVPQ